MQIIRKSAKGVEYLGTALKKKSRVLTRAVFWRIPHTSGEEEVCLKLGRYKDFVVETLQCKSPKSELTLDGEELKALIDFLSTHYAPLIDGARRYIPIDEGLNVEDAQHLRALFSNPDKRALIDFISSNNIIPEDLITSIQHSKRVKAIQEFASMLDQELLEKVWQRWFKDNQWVLGSDYVRVLEERDIDTRNISDYLMQAYDGFIDIIEIKRPGGGINFWAATRDHDNYIPSSDLIKATTQANKYVYEIEREANSQKFVERMGGVKTVKPRCVLVFGRSDAWNDEQKQAYRILNAGYHNLTILTYDHVLRRAKRIVGIEEDEKEEEDELPF